MMNNCDWFIYLLDYTLYISLESTPTCNFKKLTAKQRSMLCRQQPVFLVFYNVSPLCHFLLCLI